MPLCSRLVLENALLIELQLASPRNSIKDRLEIKIGNDIQIYDILSIRNSVLEVRYACCDLFDIVFFSTAIRTQLASLYFIVLAQFSFRLHFIL